MRLAIVTRKFWPMSGSTELAVSDLASEFKRLGHSVEIVTARWDKNWPAHFETRGIPVSRLIKPTGGPWGSFRYQRNLARTIGSLAPLDGIVLVGSGEDIEVIQRAAPEVPLVARVDYRDLPLERWKTNSRKKSFNELRRARAIVADSELTFEALVKTGLDPSQIVVIPDGVSISESARNLATQASARQAISDAHPVLAIAQGEGLVVSGAPMDSDGGLLDLISAWTIVAQEFPKSKLWLLGDGSHARYIWEHISSRDLVYNVIMPGYFDDLSDVFTAADLYVHPLRTKRSCSILTKAMGAALNPIVTQTDFTDSWVTKNVNGMMVEPRNPEALAEAIIHGLKNKDLCTRLGNESQKRIQGDLSIETQARKFLHLMSPQHDPVVHSTQ